MADLIDRKKIKAKFEPWLKVQGYSESELNMLKAVLYEITVMPSAQPDVPDTNVGDMISRQAAIDTVRSYYDECDEREESIEERIERLPSANTDLSDFSDKLWAAAYERGKAEAVRHGHWIFGNTLGHSWMKCSECLVSQNGQTATYTYCPNCGARMDEVE